MKSIFNYFYNARILEIENAALEMALCVTKGEVAALQAELDKVRVLMGDEKIKTS